MILFITPNVIINKNTINCELIVTGQTMNILLLDKLNCVDAIRVATATVIKFFGKEKGKDVFETKCDLIDSVNVVVDENKCYALYCCLVFVFFDVFRVVLLCFALFCIPWLSI